MRSDERYMMKVLEKSFLKTSYRDYKILKGDEPPDYYIITASDLIALELTQCTSFIKEGGEFVEAKSYYIPICRYFNNINRKYKGCISECVLFSVGFPIRNFRSFKNKFEKNLIGLVSTKFGGVRSGTLMVDDERIEWKRLAGSLNKGIVASIFSKTGYHEYSIRKHVDDVVRLAITKKDKKMRNLRCSKVTQRWLVLLNDYFLADLRIYKIVIDELNLGHCFDKLFVINPDDRLLLKSYYTL